MSDGTDSNSSILMQKKDVQLNLPNSQLATLHVYNSVSLQCSAILKLCK